MIKIYNIIDKNGLRYVGKTKQDLNNRLAQHKCDRKLNRNCSSKVLDLDNCIILLIEECSKEKTKEREQFWISKLKCVNQYDGNYNKINYMKEYNKRNKEKRAEWYQKNKERQNKLRNINYHKNKDLKKNLAKE